MPIFERDASRRPKNIRDILRPRRSVVAENRRPQSRNGVSRHALIVLVTCSSRVLSLLTDTTQHIHSLRASGVRSFQCASATGSESKALRKSAGTLFAVPVATFVFTGLLYQRHTKYAQSTGGDGGIRSRIISSPSLGNFRDPISQLVVLDSRVPAFTLLLLSSHPHPAKI